MKIGWSNIFSRDGDEMANVPTKNQKVYQVIFDKIKEAFLNGELKPGDKLPPERELASHYNVSRTSIREALRVLEINGIIEARQGGGTYIRSSETQSLIEKLSAIIFKVDDNFIFEMLEVRLVIESECAFLAAQRATSVDLEKIRICLDEMAKAGNDEELGLLADMKFHECVAHASRNSIFAALIQTLSEQLRDTIRTTRNHRFVRVGNFEDTLNEHKEIFLAIALNDAQKAKQLMKEHITRIREEMVRASLTDIHIE